MSSIMSISSGYDYGSIASGKQIQSASDGASELSIIQKQESQIRGSTAGQENISSAVNMLNVADGAMDGITDYLQSIRELAVQASNSILSDSDRESIQVQIEEYKKGITDIADYTTYNTKPLLDGSNEEFQIATNGDGGSFTAKTSNSTLEALGIADFDVTKDFDIGDIDNALKTVSKSRSSMGAQTNALYHAYQNNTNSVLNASAARSSLEDLDIAAAVSEKKKQEALKEYSYFMQKNLIEQEQRRFSLFV